jgi:phage tail-like protein
MRGAVANLRNPHPLGRSLPALYQEDDLAQRFLAAFDDVLAPVFCAVDNFAAYLDPALAPPDFLEWLATWVGIRFDDRATETQQRALVAEAVDLYRWRGTVRGLSQAVALATGIEPEVEESGAAVWSPVPTADADSSVSPAVKIVLRVPDPSSVDRGRLEAVVAATKPAHVAHHVEVVAG